MLRAGVGLRIRVTCKVRFESTLGPGWLRSKAVLTQPALWA